MRPTDATPDPARPGTWCARRAGRLSRTLAVVTVAVTLAGVGCRQIGKLTAPNEKGDLLEAELRTREREILELRAENQHLRDLTDIYQRSGTPYPVVPGPVAIPTGSPASPALCREIQLGTGTGGRDDDGIPGDETLQIVLVPKDDDGTAVKIPGRATVTAYEVTREGFKLPIGKWEVTNEQLKKAWRTGLIGSGYFIPLQWDKAPSTDRVRVVTRFTTGDGRDYETDKDVTVKPLPGVSHIRPVDVLPAPPASVLPPPEFPGGSTPLPPPRVVK